MSGARATVAYLSDGFPTLSEPYVPGQIDALRARGVHVFVVSARRPNPEEELPEGAAYARECIYLRPLHLVTMVLALGDCVRSVTRLRDIYARVVAGPEPWSRRMKGLMHTWLGAYVARVLRGRRVTHIHANHGHFSAWAAMIASRLNETPYSLTLHGSDLLVDRMYIDLKVRNAALVVTISCYNKRRLLEHVPDLPEHRVVVTRLGITTDDAPPIVPRPPSQSRRFVILTVGRLHAVKNHEFLIEACRQLADDGLDFECRIVGAGARRQALVRRTRELGLDDRVRLLGSMPPLDVRQQYASADLFVLTSRSEGVPIVLMEAMLHGVPVIAPAITGIPELIADGETGTLYRPGDLDDLVARIRAAASGPSGEAMRRRAQARVLADYDGASNSAAFAEQLVAAGASVAPKPGCDAPS